VYTDADGQLAIRVARDALEAHVLRRTRGTFEFPERFREKAGAFVTVNRHPSGELRGCIGYPSPFFPLHESLVRAAEGATEDPRFPPLERRELDQVTVEVSLLTPPRLLSAPRPKDLPGQVKVGRDGLIAAKGRTRGVLLPQVPVEWGWDGEEFLSQVCMKAGLPPDAWLDGETLLYAFEAELFTEEQPMGPAVRRHLESEHARH